MLPLAARIGSGLIVYVFLSIFLPALQNHSQIPSTENCPVHENKIPILYMGTHSFRHLNVQYGLERGSKDYTPT